jgi:hypothetical protein
MNKHEATILDQATDDLDGYLWFLQKLAATRGGYFAWQAIQICIWHERKFPTWIIDYLSQCAERMQSDRARRDSDVRKTMQWIFEFPKNKPGPGGLNQDRELQRELQKWAFAVDFAQQIRQGEDPIEARKNAAIEFLPDNRRQNTATIPS